MTTDIHIKKYSPDLKEIWNDFVESSKNGTFLFNRGYMDYHSHRFVDSSLLIYRKGKLYCLLPANKSGSVFVSHGGLTYGGLIMNRKCTAEGILEVFVVLKDYLKGEGYKQLIYKPVPYIYTVIPSQEDLYALFRSNASLSIRNISSTIFTFDKLNFIKDRRAAVRRAISHNIRIKETSALPSFWEILEDNLGKKYNVRPIHSLEEMQSLQAKFPENIRLFGAFKENKMLGGVLCYVTKTTVHLQYISASSEGKTLGAIDLIIEHLLNVEFSQVPYFDFGTSNEDGGRYLNESLIYQKEGFGGRGVCYDTYEVLL